MNSQNHTYFSDTCVHILSSSHNDIGFLDSPLATTLFRNTNIIEQAIIRMEEDPTFRHSMECVLYLKDYLTLHPDMKERLCRVLVNGQFGCGATFTQCYETSLTSEALVRQFYLGKRWLEKTFPGVHLRTVWNVDVPSRAKQSAQVMKKCGVEYLFISRMDAGFFHWYSPDGSKVSGYSTGHYHHNSLNQILDLKYEVYEQHDADQKTEKIQGNIENGRNSLTTYLDAVASYYQKRSIPPLLALLSIRDYDYPINLKPYLEEIRKKTTLPFFMYSSTETFMEQAERELDPILHYNHYHGERPNLWVYHQPTHAKAFWYNRNGMNLLEEVERLSSVGLLEGIPYEQQEIDTAWEELLYLDHGWGGANGHITDETYLQISKKGYERALRLHINIREKIASLIAVPTKGSFLTVFNTTFKNKTDSVSCLIDWRSLGSVFFSVLDPTGIEIPFQIVEEPSPYHIRILFPATVPALGHVRYLLSPIKKAPEEISKAIIRETVGKICVENHFYTLEVSRGGITSLLDKETGEQLVNQAFPLALFEVFVVDSCGNGSGEFSEVQQANPVFGTDQNKYWLGSGYTESSSRQNIHWRIARYEGLNQPDGKVATCIIGEAKFPHFVLKQEIIVHHHLKKIDANVGIEAWDGTMYKEIRINIPFKPDGTTLSYAIPLGILEIGKDEVNGAVGTMMFTNDGKTVFYPTPCGEIHPREVQSWIAISKPKYSILLGCPDTPTFDFDQKIGTVQPILLASRHSCLATANPYHQRGDHHFSFSLTSQTGKQEDRINAIEGVQHCLEATISYGCIEKQGLPLSRSNINIEGQVKLSALKKAEDSNNLILRLYEPYGRTAPFSIELERGISSVMKTDLLEYGGSPYSATRLSDTLGPYAVETYCITTPQAHKKAK